MGIALIKNIALAIRFATREMRAGLRGFVIFFACIVLGVVAIASVNGVSMLIGDEFASQGRAILGGDLRITMTQSTPTVEEATFFDQQGQVSSSVWMRSMARNTGARNIGARNGEGAQSAENVLQQLVEIKAIDKTYPLVGVFETEPAFDFEALFAPRDGIAGVVLAPSLMQRLEAEIGDMIEIGTQSFEVRGIVVNEPDLLSEGLQWGLRVFMAQDTLLSTGLLQEGSLYARIYKIAMPAATDAEIDALAAQLKQDFPDRTWNVRSRANAAPTLEVNIKRFLQFLTLVGLTALIVGGTGVAQAVSAYLDKKREVIAIFKTLGAGGSFIVIIYLVQILMIGLMAIALGLSVAAFVPSLLAQILQQFLPVSSGFVFYPISLLMGASFALLAILAFSLIPLGRAQASHVTSLFRSSGLNGRASLPLFYRLASIALLALMAVLAVAIGDDRRLALIFIVAMAGVFGLLKLLDVLIELLARRFSHSRFLGVRLALGNIHRPGSLTAAVVRALGLGLTLLVALTSLDGNLRKQLSSAALERAPAFFFLDIASHQGEEFREFLASQIGGEQALEDQVQMMPILRARLVQLKGVTAEQAKIDEDGRWVLRGDRNVGFSHTLPEAASLIKGTWWEEEYSGPPLVSFSAREAANLKLDIGDTIHVNVLGRVIEARIANLRAVDWDSMRMNFVMIFSPNTFAGAPYTYLSTLTMSPDAAKEAKIAAGLGQLFPSLTIISTRDILQNAHELAEQIGLGVRISAAVVILASILVLAGALSAGNERRAQMAVVLKILGARRIHLIGAFILEYAILGLLTAIFAFIAGSAAGVGVARWRMNLSQAEILPETALLVILVALIVSVGLGLVGTWRVLGQKPAQVLREL